MQPLKEWFMGWMEHIKTMLLFLFLQEPQNIDPDQPTTVRKKYDSTPFTQQHYDYIIKCYEKFTRHNTPLKRAERKTQQDLADILNRRLKLNKSVHAYSRVWRHMVDRDALATGAPLKLHYSKNKASDESL